MNLIFSVIAAVLAGITFGMSFVKFTHFFQLNTYRAKIQIKWMKEHPSKFFANIFFGALGIAFSLLNGSIYTILFAVSMIIGLLLSVPKKAKKPLVCTMRVKRLFITAVVVYAICFVFAIFFPPIFKNIKIIFLLVSFMHLKVHTAS